LVFNVPLGLGDSVSGFRGRRECAFKTLIQKLLETSPSA
jgi:hypothetical protein